MHVHFYRMEIGEAFLRAAATKTYQSFHRLLHTHHHPSTAAGTSGQIVADVPNGLSLTTSRETN
jgi:hypothetical protein